MGLHPVSWETWLKQRRHTRAPGSLCGSWGASYSSLVCLSCGGGWPSSSVWRVQCKLAGEQLNEDNYHTHSTHSRGELTPSLFWSSLSLPMKRRWGRCEVTLLALEELALTCPCSPLLSPVQSVAECNPSRW